MGDYKTKQEEFWAGSFGNEYIGRNKDEDIIRRLLPFWADILRRTGGISSVLELGANVGLNLRTLKLLSPASKLSAVEINENAVGALREWGECEVFQGSILDFEPSRKGNPQNRTEQNRTEQNRTLQRYSSPAGHGNSSSPREC
jgi:spore coat polysaccharide biosynthesis protein SpsF